MTTMRQRPHGKGLGGFLRCRSRHVAVTVLDEQPTQGERELYLRGLIKHLEQWRLDPPCLAPVCDASD